MRLSLPWRRRYDGTTWTTACSGRVWRNGNEPQTPKPAAIARRFTPRARGYARRETAATALLRRGANATRRRDAAPRRSSPPPRDVPRNSPPSRRRRRTDRSRRRVHRVQVRVSVPVPVRVRVSVRPSPGPNPGRCVRRSLAEARRRALNALSRRDDDGQSALHVAALGRVREDDRLFSGGVGSERRWGRERDGASRRGDGRLHRAATTVKARGGVRPRLGASASAKDDAGGTPVTPRMKGAVRVEGETRRRARPRGGTSRRCWGKRATKHPGKYS